MTPLGEDGLLQAQEEWEVRQLVTPRPTTSLDEAIQSVTRASESATSSLLAMPWDIGFAGMVLGSSPVIPMGLLEPKAPASKTIIGVEDEVAESPMDMDDKQVEKWTVAKVRKTMQQEDVEERRKAYDQWLVVISLFGPSNRVVQDLDHMGDGMLDDLFAKKKTGTLKVRVSSVLLYIRWCQSRALQPFPMAVRQVYWYVDDLRKSGAPATRASSFRSAVAFMKGVFNVENADLILDSALISGSCHRNFMTKRILKQRDALKVDHVGILETILTQADNLQEKVFAGHCLLCLYGRLRFGDSQNIQEEPQLEEEFLEAGISMHKTDSLHGRARRMLPVAAPAIGVTKTNWAADFLQARKDAGLRGGPERPFMPAPLLGGGWSPGKLKTPEAGMWLREILQKYSIVKLDLTNTGSHSLKATTLAWLAKAGVAEKTRRMLGYHVKPADRSMVIYSRDALASGLEALRDVVLQIALGKFLPDKGRSGRWAGREKVQEIEEIESDQSDDSEVLEEKSPGVDSASGQQDRSVASEQESDTSGGDSDETEGEESQDG